MHPVLLLPALLAASQGALSGGQDGCSAELPSLSATGALVEQAKSRSSPCGKAEDFPDDIRPARPLDFAIDEGNTRNRFFRNGPIAAHLLTTSGRSPRFIAAFPAGNSGAGIRFQAGEETPFTFSAGLTPLERGDRMRGVSTVLEAGTTRLTLEGAVLGSVREIRDYTEGPHKKDRWPAVSGAGGDGLTIHHTAPDGRSRVEVSITPLDGARLDHGPDGSISIVAPPGSGRVRFRISSLTDEPPLTPMDPLRPGVDADPSMEQILAFLSYREKLLAGSWRFLTYFGRDTLISTRLLMRVLKPEAVEAALAAVIERLGPGGEVCHEEEVGEWAAAENLKDDLGDSRELRCSYKMIDTDFLLAPVLVEYLRTPAGCARAAAFLARKTPAGVSYAEALRKNLQRVVGLAAPYAKEPSVRNMIIVGSGEYAGDWRDSEEGLGGGIAPYDVNAILVPAALRAVSALGEIPGLDSDATRRATQLIVPWEGAGRAFQVAVPRPTARRRVRRAALEQGLDPGPALAALQGTGPVRFPAVALFARDGVPVPVMHSDDSLSLLFGHPGEAEIQDILWRATSPYPAGLNTPFGMVVANAAYADGPALRRAQIDPRVRELLHRHNPGKPYRDLFDSSHYHGAVDWPWQNAAMIEGLDLQAGRFGPALGARMRQARSTLLAGSASLGAHQPELFKPFAHGTWMVVPFGQTEGDSTESNAAQLWSTVFLGLPEAGEVAWAGPGAP